MNQHDPRVLRTQQLLQQAFLDLLMVKSFEELTVKDIAERAMVNRATFYAHFEDKYALLDETIRRSFLHTLRQRLPTGEMTCAADIDQVILAVCDFLCQFDGACRRVERRFEVLVEKEIKALLTGVVQSWLARSAAAADPQFTATMVSWAIYGAVLHWSHQRPRPAADSFAPTVVPRLREGGMTLAAE